MPKKKLEVVELDKEKEKIVLEENLSHWAIFWKKYGIRLCLTTLIVSLLILLIIIFMTISNLNTSDKPIIKEVSIDVNLSDASISLDQSTSLTNETAKNTFLNSGKFKSKGEVLLVKTIETGSYTLKFYSDYTAIKIMKDINLATRINPIDEKTYGIDEEGVTNSKAIILDVTKTETKKYSWGTVNYYSDGSAEIIDSKIDMYVRNSKDINENYISDNKVSYLRETKTIGDTELNYYYDGTIQVIKNKKTYLVRNEQDLNINNNNVTFKNENESTIYKTIKLNDGKTIDYYTDGGAIINDGSRTISVRKSNSIIIKDNKIYEIVDNIYVEISGKADKDNITYYTNGSAVVKDYNGKTIYVEENSNIKHKNNKINDITSDYEELTDERNINGDKILKFETVAVVEKEEYTAIVPIDSIIYDKDGALKDIIDYEPNNENNPIRIINNTNDQITYRLVIEKSEKTNLNIEYIRYQLSVGNNYIEPRRLDSQIWNTDEVSEQLDIAGTNYILLEKTLEPLASDEIKLMLWTDYDTIPNSMQDKYFYGTIKIYAYQQIDKNL